MLFNQRGQRLSLPAIQPTGDNEEQQPEDRHLEHDRSC
jgi:hypothetical protein